MNHPNEHASYWSLKLLGILQEMAGLDTNAVLQILSGADRLESERRYPEHGLLFADNQWRVFYHCHKDNLVHPDEHGHFHIFTDTGNQEWAHLAGLSIDVEGQPLQWFMVNRWVTGGPWLARELFVGNLRDVTIDDTKEALLENWLCAMMQLYSDTLNSLLEERDKQVVSRTREAGRDEMLEDREIYTLATQEINLQVMLEKSLLQYHMAMPQQVLSYKKCSSGRAG